MTARDPQVVFKFRLYVADCSQNSIHAIANFKALCHAHLRDRCEMEIIDVFKEPQRAIAENVLMTPTLIKFEPSPVRRIVGTLRDTETVLRVLGLESPLL